MASAKPVDEDTLRRLKEQGVESRILDLRLEYMELEGLARYVRGLVGKDRVYPRMLPTQASGRWSTTGPPRVNFPAHDPAECERCTSGEPLVSFEDAAPWCPRAVRQTILPDPGTWWLHFDLDAIEGRYCAAYSRDEEELEAYRKSWDIHTINVCRLFGWEYPPVLSKRLHTDDSCRQWREVHQWGGGDDRRRHLCKTLKYALQFAWDHKGANNAKGVEKLGLTKKQVEGFAKQYMKAKPILTAYKARMFEEFAKTSVSYTFRGRRRRLFGDAKTRAKEGFSHKIQGSVPDIMNDYIIQIQAAFPESWLILNAHDGLEWCFPDHLTPEQVVPIVKKIVERDWDVEGVMMPVTGSWEIIRADGSITRA